MFGDLANQWWIFILLGIIAGTASGLLGIGGGVIIVPALVLAATAFDQKTAQGTALAVMIPLAIVGTIRYMQNPEITISWTVVILIASGAVAGTLIGTALAARLPVNILRKIFAVLMVIVAFKMFLSKPQAPATKTRADQPTACRSHDNENPSYTDHD